MTLEMIKVQTVLLCFLSAVNFLCCLLFSLTEVGGESVEEGRQTFHLLLLDSTILLKK